MGEYHYSGEFANLGGGCQYHPPKQNQSQALKDIFANGGSVQYNVRVSHECLPYMINFDFNRILPGGEALAAPVKAAATEIDRENGGNGCILFIRQTVEWLKIGPVRLPKTNKINVWVQ